VLVDPVAKPMIFRLLARAVSSHSSARSGVPTSFIMSMTASLAPPCSGPLSARWRQHGAVEIVQGGRAVKVEALKLCSAYGIREVSNAAAMAPRDLGQRGQPDVGQSQVGGDHGA
jgi:hypothetical protein